MGLVEAVVPVDAVVVEVLFELAAVVRAVGENLEKVAQVGDVGAMGLAFAVTVVERHSVQEPRLNGRDHGLVRG